LYLPSISEACLSRPLFVSLVAMLCQCVLNNRLEAHHIAHELYSGKDRDLVPIVASLRQDFLPLAEAVAVLCAKEQPSKEQQLIQF